MSDILRDPAVSLGVAIFFGLAGLVATLISVRASRRRKALSYGVLPATSIITVHEEAKNKVQVTFNDIPVTDAQLLRVFIVNTGNLPIAENDFSGPVKLLFEGESQILTATVVSTNPPRLPASLTHNKSAVEIAPLLLNNGDWIEVNVLTSEYRGNMTVDARINGVARITELNANKLVLKESRLSALRSLLQFSSLASLLMFAYFISVSELALATRLALFLQLALTTALGLIDYERKIVPSELSPHGAKSL